MADTVNVEYVVIKAPLEWFRTYHKILELLACWGERKVVNPKCKCSGSSDIIIEAYELYQSAVAAYNLDKEEEGEQIIKHIDSLLEGYESAESFVVTIDGTTYMFTKDDIIVIDDSSSDSYSESDDSSQSDSVNQNNSSTVNTDTYDSSDSSSDDYDDMDDSSDENTNLDKDN